MSTKKTTPIEAFSEQRVEPIPQTAQPTRVLLAAVPANRKLTLIR